jgi:hypothetical protein
MLVALAAGPADAAATGVGTASAETTVIAVELGTNGSLLGVRLLGDSGRSTIDPKTASAAEAFSKFTGVNVSSSTISTLNKTEPAIESRQPGGEKEVNRGSVNLSSPADGVTVPTSVLTGTLGFATLTSEATAAAAKSSLSASLTNASLAGTLATVRGATSSLATSVSSTASEATRSVKVDHVVVLDLSSLLEALNLSLSDLPVDTVIDLLDSLGVTVPGVGTAAAVETAVNTLKAAIDDVNTTIDGVDTAIDAVQAEITGLDTVSVLTPTILLDVVNTVNGLGQGDLIDPTTLATITTVAGLVAVLTDVLADLNATLDDLQATLDDLRDDLADLLGDVLEVLDGAALLTADGAEASVTTKAADTVANSVATKTAKLGSITVGDRVISSGADLTQAVATIDATEVLIDTTISGVTDDIDPALATLVDTDLFAPAVATPVSESGGYVKATEGVTVLTAKVTPPAALAAIIAGFDADTSIAEEIDTYGGDAPDVAPEMQALESEMGGTVHPASDGANFKVAQVLGTSEFAPGAVGFPGSGINPSPGTGTTGGPDTGRSLPATGANSIPMTAFALFLVALGLGFRQWIDMPVPAQVRAVRLRLPNRMR